MTAPGRLQWDKKKQRWRVAKTWAQRRATKKRKEAVMKPCAFLLAFLKQMEEAWPPSSFRHHHALLYCKYGNDKDGFKDKLALQVNVGDLWQAFFLDEEDFEKPVWVLVSEIVTLLKQPNPTNLQTSREVGTFTRDCVKETLNGKD